MENYMLLSWLILSVAIFLGLWYSRTHWLHYCYSCIPNTLYTRLPESFQDDLESGLSSDTFSLSQNLTDNDTRAGLDVAAKKEVLKIMRRRGLGFDDARSMYMQQKMSRNNIGPDGRPLDPRAVFFS